MRYSIMDEPKDEDSITYSFLVNHICENRVGFALFVLVFVIVYWIDYVNQLNLQLYAAPINPFIQPFSITPSKLKKPRKK